MTKKAREEKSKAKAKTVERARTWAEAKAKENIDIYRVNAEATERARA